MACHLLKIRFGAEISEEQFYVDVSKLSTKKYAPIWKQRIEIIREAE